MVALSVEGWHTGDSDVKDNSARPDIAFLVVSLVQNLRSDVVRSSKLFVQVLVGIKGEGGSEVNNLDLIEIFVLFEENVLRLEISIEVLAKREKLTCERCGFCGNSSRKIGLVS